jgi:hypothetical protein
MSYKVLAHGPVVGGNMTIPYRVVLLGWYTGSDDDRPESNPQAFSKFTTHTQSFVARPGEPREARLTGGHYFSTREPNALEEAYVDFTERLSYDAENYGHNVKLDLNPADYAAHDQD